MINRAPDNKPAFDFEKFDYYYSFACRLTLDKYQNTETVIADPLELLKKLLNQYLHPPTPLTSNKFFDNSVVRKVQEKFLFNRSYRDLCEEIFKLKTDNIHVVLAVIDNYLAAANVPGKEYNSEGDFHALLLAFFTCQYELCLAYKDKPDSVLQSVADLASTMPTELAKTIYEQLTAKNKANKISSVATACKVIIACAKGLPEYNEKSKKLLWDLLQVKHFKGTLYRINASKLTLCKALLSVDQSQEACSLALKLAKNTLDQPTATPEFPDALQVLAAIEEKQRNPEVMETFLQVLNLVEKNANYYLRDILPCVWKVYASNEAQQETSNIKQRLIEWLEKLLNVNPSKEIKDHFIDSLVACFNYHLIDEKIAGFLSKLLKDGRVGSDNLEMLYPFFNSQDKKILLTKWSVSSKKTLAWIDPAEVDFNLDKLLYEISVSLGLKLFPSAVALIKQIPFAKLTEQNLKELFQQLNKQISSPTIGSVNFLEVMMEIVENKDLAERHILIVERFLQNVLGQAKYRPLKLHHEYHSDVQLRELNACLALLQVQRLCQYKKHCNEASAYVLNPTDNNYLSTLPVDVKSIVSNYLKM